MKRLFNVKKHFAIFAIMATAMMLPDFTYAITTQKQYDKCKHTSIADDHCTGCNSYVIEYDYTANNNGAAKQGIKLNSTAGQFGDAVYLGTAQVGGKWYWFFDRVVTHIESGAFDKNKMEISISEVDLPEGVTTLDPDVFAGCVTLENITLPSTLTTIGSGAFSGCTNLETITIPEGVTTIEPNAFSGCTSLESVTLPSTVTSIGEGAFNGCSDLDNITIPENVTSIGAGAFSGCTDLTTVVIPDNVTTIGNNAFSGCTNLESVTVGEGVASIGQNAFAGCDNISEVTFNSCPTVAPGAFPETKEDVSRTLELTDKMSVSDFVNLSKSPNVKYTEAVYPREMSGLWGAVCLPFDSKSDNSVWFYELSEQCTDELMVFSKVENAKANMPYVIFKMDETASKVNISADFSSLTNGAPGEQKVVTENGVEWKMIGSFTSERIDALSQRNSGYEYFFVNNSNISHVVKSLSVKPYRAYFQAKGYKYDPNSSSATMRMSVEEANGFETGMLHVDLENQENDVLYDLLGNRVSKMIEGRIYIINGRKVIFK